MANYTIGSPISQNIIDNGNNKSNNLTNQLVTNNKLTIMNSNSINQNKVSIINIENIKGNTKIYLVGGTGSIIETISGVYFVHTFGF